jgi:cephalosporin hydroxylase
LAAATSTMPHELDISLDHERGVLRRADGTELPLYSRDAFALLSRIWTRAGWGLKYTYGFTWLGRPIIQLPEDMIRAQELLVRVRPDVVVETGVAHGGSLVYYASLLPYVGGRQVVGVDIEIRPHNRKAIEEHLLASSITLVEGDSVAPDTLAAVRAALEPDDRVVVFLDSNHTYEHVLAELEAYCDFVTPGSYIVATDGIMEDLVDVPGGGAGWASDNPRRAAADFLKERDDFELEEPLARLFNEGQVDFEVTHWPGSYLRRRG